MSRVLIAGMGNVLRRDDGFGVQVARRLAEQKVLPADVKVVEVGIGGIHLVHELMAGYDVLMVVDTVERGSAPGTLHVLKAEVPDLNTWSEERRHDFLADMHYTTPSKALILAKALNVLPPQVYIIGCQPGQMDDLGIGLTEPMEQGAQDTVLEIKRIVEQIMQQEIDHSNPEETRSGKAAAES